MKNIPLIHDSKQAENYATIKNDFHPDHLIDLSKSGLSEGSIIAARIRSVSPCDIARKLGVNDNNIISMYEIPYTAGHSRFRLFYKKGAKGHKYRQKKGTGNHLYAPLGITEIFSDTKIPLYITEGEKKALKACQEGIPCVALGGLWNWSNGKSPRGLIDDFNSINFQDRKVYIVPDNDWQKQNIKGYRSNLKQAVYQLADKLIDQGAAIYWVELAAGELKGLDDYLCRNSVEDFYKLPVHEILQQKTEAESDSKTIVMQKFYPRPFAEILLKHNIFIYEGSLGYLWRFDTEAGIWKNNGLDFLDKFIRSNPNILESRMIKKNTVAEIIADIKGLTYSETGLPEPDINLIPFQNGVFDLRNNSLTHFSPKMYFTWKLPFDYNPNAKSEFLSNLMGSFLPEDESITLWELLGYSLWRSYPYQRIFFIYGKGRNGKSLFTNIMSNMLGNDNISNVNLSDMQKSRFASASLNKKLVNICGESGHMLLENTDILKALTGGDKIEADIKYMNPINFTNYAKLIFLANQIPPTVDTSDAFYRRMFIVEFSKQFSDDPSIQVMINELPNEEYEWLLFNAMAHLMRLKDNSFTFSKHDEINNSRLRYNSLANPISSFIEDCCLNDADEVIIKSDFLAKFNEWLTDRGRPSYSGERIGKEMKRLGYESRRVGSAPDRSRPYAWEGLKWKPA